MLSEREVIALQFTASIFMAADYFLDDRQRRYINVNLRFRLRKLQANIKLDVKSRTSNLRELAQDFIIATLLWATVWVLPRISSAVIPASWQDVASLVALIPLGMLAFRYWKPQLDFIVELALLAFSILPLSVVLFLRRCPKGTVFGIGYVILVFTFSVRYAQA